MKSIFMAGSRRAVKKPDDFFAKLCCSPSQSGFRMIKSIKKRNWNIRVMIEGEKTARLFAIEQKLPLPNENFDAYPVEILVKEQFTFFELMKKVVQFSKMGIYSVAYKEPR